MTVQSTAAADPVVIVGAGMAGLTCASILHRAGRRTVVLEAGDRIGGRIRTDRHPDGFVIDRGFQVVLDAYPALRRHVNLDALQLGAFDAGAMIWTGRRLTLLADPIRHPSALLEDLKSSVISIGDKVRLASFAAQCRLSSWGSANEAAGDWDKPALETLQSAGFSSRFIDRFARPFWGGISLDPALSGSQGPLKFTLKMFLQGSAALPAGGIQSVPEQLAALLPSDTIRLRHRVNEIVISDGRAAGVVVNGERLAASAVVVAADSPTARQLTGIGSIPIAGVGWVTVFLRSRRDPGSERGLCSTARDWGPSTTSPRYPPSRRVTRLLASIFSPRSCSATLR